MTDNTGNSAASLASTIANTAYQTGTESGGVIPGTENLTGVPGGVDNPPYGLRNEDLSSVAGNDPRQTQATQAQTGVTTPDDHGAGETPSTDPRDQRINELVETIQNQSRIYEQTLGTFQQREAERLQALARQQEAQRDQQFLQSIAHLDANDPDRRAAVAEYRANKYQLQLQTQQQQIAQQRQQQQAQEQMSAKRQLAWLIAQEHGIDPELSDTLMGAQSEQHMVELAQRLSGRLAPAAQAQGVQQVWGQVPQGYQQPLQQLNDSNPAFAAGVEGASGAPSVDIPDGSGDLASLIANTGYSMMQVVE